MTRRAAKLFLVLSLIPSNCQGRRHVVLANKKFVQTIHEPLPSLGVAQVVLNGGGINNTRHSTQRTAIPPSHSNLLSMKRIEPIRHALAGAPQCHQHHKRTRSYSADEITDVKRARHTAIETQCQYQIFGKAKASNFPYLWRTVDKEEEEPELELYSEISGALRLSDIEEESDESLSDQKRYHSYEGRPLSSRAQALDPGTYRSVGLRGSSDVIGFDREPTVDPPETLLTAPRCSRISPEEVDDLYTYSELYSEDERDNSDDESEGSARTCPFDEIRTVVTADGDLDVIVSLRQEFSNMPVRLYVQRHSELSAEHHTRATESCKSTLTSRSPESPDFVPSTTSAASTSTKVSTDHIF